MAVSPAGGRVRLSPALAIFLGVPPNRLAPIPASRILSRTAGNRFSLARDRRRILILPPGKFQVNTQTGLAVVHNAY